MPHRLQTIQAIEKWDREIKQAVDACRAAYGGSLPWLVETQNWTLSRWVEEAWLKGLVDGG